jgi:hypothetical protein
MKKEIPLIEFHQGLPTMDTLTEWGAIHSHNIVVLDDLMMDAANSDEIVHLMCIGSHHHQISHTHITKLISKGEIDDSCFPQLSFHFNGEQINTLGRQVFPGQLKFFMRSFELATEEKFSYLLLDLFPRSDKSY